MSQKNPGVLYLFKDKFQIYTPLPPKVLEFNFVTDLVKDMDIINKDLFSNILSIFIQTNKIPPGNLDIVISNDACITSDFAKQNSTQPQSEKNREELNENIKKFLEYIPYENVANQELDTISNVRVFAANQDLFESIKFAFEKQGFIVDLVLPIAVFEENIQKTPVLNTTIANSILQAAPSLKKYNFLTPPIYEQNTKVEEKKDNSQDSAQQEVVAQEVDERPATSKAKTDKKRLIMLSGVFGFLLILLVVVYIASNQSTDTNRTTNAQQPVSTVESINP